MEALLMAAKGQCSRELIQQLKSYPAHKTSCEKPDALGLMKLVESIVLNQYRECYQPLAILEALRNYLQCFQGERKEQAYFGRLHAARQMLRMLSVRITFDPLTAMAKTMLYPLIPPKSLHPNQLASMAAGAEDIFHACLR